MIKTFIKTAIRQLLSNRLVYSIDILVLAVMVACCLLIGIQIIKHHNFDQFHSKADRVVRVDYIYKDSQNRYHDEGLMDNAFFDDFKKDLPQVVNSTRFRSCKEWIKQNENSINVRLAFVDSAFLEMFNFNLLEGDQKTVLDDPNNIVISVSTAEKLTGITEDFNQLLGQTITLPNTEQKDFTITGILEDVSEQSSIDFDLLVAYPHSVRYPRSSSGMGDTYIFLEIDRQDNIINAQDGLNGLVDNYFGEKVSEAVEAGYLSPDEDVLRFELRPMSSLYLDNSVSHHYMRSTDVKELGMIRYVAIVIFILAILNHLTLSLSLSVRRTGELTIKRVIGARKANLFFQFLVEAGLVGLISVAIGIIIYSWTTPWVNTWFGWKLNFNDLLNHESGILVGCLFFGILLLSCLTLFARLVVKPGFGLRSGKVQRARLSTGFTVFQYCISFVLITAAILVFRQLEFMRTKELGFNDEGVMVIELPDSFSEELRDRFKSLLTNHSSTQSIAASDRDFVSGSLTWDVPLPDGRELRTRAIRIENEYVKTLGLTLLEGNDLDPNRMDQPEILVNETFVKESGIENPVGHFLDIEVVEGEKTRISGVIKDFHFDAVNQPIQPLFLANAPINSIWNVFIRYNQGRLDDARSHIISAWKEVEPTLPLSLSFMDEKMDGRYQKEERFGRVITSASIVAILITAFGLFSLSMITLTTRIKEIGIRKANGAQSLDIYTQFVKKYFKWVLISITIGVPVSWYLMDTWLQNFPYRTPLDWWVFVLAGLLALGIALLTVSWQSWKAATRNPVEALRYE
ncbi:MAG: FtsX-like permease family protein [Cyclobacteriaceae bacterium]